MKPPMSEIWLEEFRYDLPDERVAKHPVSPRDSSKLLIYRQGEITHQHFTNLADHLPENSFLVFNDTKVIPARIYLQKPTGGIIEIFLLNPEQPTRLVQEAMQVEQTCVWECMIGNKKRWKTGEVYDLKFAGAGEANRWFELRVELVDSAKNWVRFSWQETKPETNNAVSIPFVEVIKALGEIPLPPYLNRATEAADSQTYQTVYSKTEGAVAAPTAGLHFTENVFQQLAKKQIGHDFVTLHVGAGTFQPVKEANALAHVMHAEQMVFSKQLLENLYDHAENIVAVGTTSLRSLESLYWFGLKLSLTQDLPKDEFFYLSQFEPYQHENRPFVSAKTALMAIVDYLERNNLEELMAETAIYILPGYEFKMCKGLITNYHQPGSTLMLLVAAFVGNDWKKIYAEALTNNYRFLSYGDSSLLLRS